MRSPTASSDDRVDVAPDAVRATSDDVSVIIPCRNEARRIEALLDAIREQDVPVSEVIVVDTGSVDETPDIVRRYGQRYPDLSVKWLSEPGAGIAEAVNRGIRAAQGEVIVRLDGHAQPRPDYVRKVVDGLNETGVGVIGGVWDIAPGESTGVAQAIAWAVAHPVGAGGAAYRTAGRAQSRMEVDTVPFGCFRVSTWEDLGGFNETLLSNEDYEFNYRIRSRGAAVVLDPEVRCTYFARGTLADLARQYFRYGWWKAQMLKSHPGSLRWRQALPGALIPTFVVLAVASFVWPAAAFLLGGLTAAYLAALTGAAVHTAARERRWALMGPLVAAFGIVHLAWSSGFAVNFGTGGRWPVWQPDRAMRKTGSQLGFAGFTLVWVLLSILVLALVVPPGLATLVNRSRIKRAEGEVRLLAEALQPVIGEARRVSGAANRQETSARLQLGEQDLLGGPGDAPKGLEGSVWVGGRLGALDRYLSRSLRPDPWGNRYLVNIGVVGADGPAASGSRPFAVWILSAGPNGIVETPYRDPATSSVLGGDDIGAQIP